MFGFSTGVEIQTPQISSDSSTRFFSCITNNIPDLIMTMPARNSLEDLERLRLLLEENISKLRKALQYWQKWEVEYEGLKEELAGLPENATRDDIVRSGLSFEGTLVNEKEINEIIGKGPSRTPKQVIGLVSRRIDYVEQNIKSIQKQLAAAEDKRGAATIVSQPEAVLNEEGLPLTEIYEELDEEGNVILGRIQRPGEAATHMLEALKQAGVKDEDLLDSIPVAPMTTEEEEGKVDGRILSEIPSNGNDIDKRSVSPPAEDAAPLASARPRKKSVSFADGTKDEALKATSTAHSIRPDTDVTSPSATSSRMSEFLKGSFTGGERVIELDENDTPIAFSTPTIPVDESREDAALRRQMLQYNMTEVGNIVAELDLEEDRDSDYDEDYSDDEDGERGSPSGADEENEFGMETQGILSDEYRKQMTELEKRLNAQMLQNIGPESTTDDKARVELAKGARYLRVLPDDAIHPVETTEEFVKDKPKSKNVRFVPALNVAPAKSTTQHPTSQPQASPKPHSKPQPATAVHETITERRTTPTTTVPTAPTTKPPSRFKVARASAAAASTTPSLPPPLPTPSEQPSTRRPTGPTNAIVAPSLIERATSTATLPPEPDEFDPEIMKQEVAREYYAQRNRMVQKEGGFLRFAGEGESSLPEEDERGLQQGKGERVSLFKAARLRMGGGGGNGV